MIYLTAPDILQSMHARSLLKIMRFQGMMHPENLELDTIQNNRL